MGAIVLASGPTLADDAPSSTVASQGDENVLFRAGEIGVDEVGPAGGGIDLQAVARDIRNLGSRALDDLVRHKVYPDSYGGGHALEPGYSEFGVEVEMSDSFAVVPAYSVVSPDAGMTFGEGPESHGFRLRARYNF